MRFAILGTTRATRADGRDVPLGGPARRALLALLLARAGEVVPASGLIDGLYGEHPPGDAAHALQSQVSRLRAALRPEATIELLPAGYRLTVDPADVDAHRFLRLADEGRAALDGDDPALAADLLRQALALWRGPAMADAGGPDAVRLEERGLAALEDRFEADLRRGHTGITAELGEAVGRHPLRERLRGLLMRALHAEGRQAEALVLYERTRRLLADELGADPSAELAAIHRALLRGERTPGPVAPPAQLTSFVGREDDVAGVRALLTEARLVTLLGPGGAGKTRLSIEVAAGGQDTCFAELAALRAGAELPQALLGALGLRESGLLAPAGGTTPADRLVAALAERSLLLVLDNCEHLVGPVAALAERLLASCPGLRVLATSREPLGITGEHLWPVSSLTPEAAARLFTDRAAAVRPGFGAAEGAVRRVCAALDGLPLAIELAAARTRTHEVAELADRLDDRFRLLSRGSRTAQARHQTLRAVVAWSWDLLTEPERVMARRLTVFSGAVSAGDAGAVCGLPDPDELLDSLADKSLLEASGGRYRMLQTIHAFCAEQLTEAGEEQAVRQAHARHFLDLAERADPHLRRAGQLDWLETLAVVHDDLMGALRWSAESGRAAQGVRLVAALSSYLWVRGVRASATGHAIDLLDLLGDDPDPALGDDYVLCALVAASDPAAWSRHRPAAETMAQAPDRPRRHPLVTILWPMVTAGDADPRLALAIIERGRESADPWERAIVHAVWGYPNLATGDFGAAEHEFTLALEGFRALGDGWGAALALDALSWLAGLRGDGAEARVLIDEALELTGRLGALEDLSDLLCNRGDHRLGDDLDGACADYEQAEAAARRSGSATCLAAALRGRGDVARLHGDLAGARRLYEQALDRFDPQWVRSVGSRCRALIGLGLIAEAEGDLVTAGELHLRATEAAVNTGALPEAARAIEALAGIELARGMPAAAAKLLGGAAVLRGLTLASEVGAAARAALGESAYAAAHDAGERLSHEEVLRLAGLSEEVISRSPIMTVRLW